MNKYFKLIHERNQKYLSKKVQPVQESIIETVQPIQPVEPKVQEDVINPPAEWESVSEVKEYNTIKIGDIITVTYEVGSSFRLEVNV